MRTGTSAYERMNVSTDAIPSYIEQMNPTMTTTNEDLCSRRDQGLEMCINKVTSACISDIVAIIEFMDRITRRSESTFTLVHQGVSSVTYAAIIAIVFEKMSIHFNVTSTANMILRNGGHDAGDGRLRRGEEERQRAGVQKRVRRGVSSLAGQHVRVLHGGHPQEEFCTMAMYSMVRNFVKERDILIKALPCSDPKENVVRVVPLMRTDDLATSKIMERVADRPVFGRLRWYVNMLRCINVNGMCDDCSIAYRIASSMLPSETDKESMGDEGRQAGGPAFTDIIKELRSIAKVPVYVDMKDRLMEGADMDSILIDRVRMLDLIEAYEFMRTSVYRAWSDLPEPPVSDKTHVFTWMLSAESYRIKTHIRSGLLTRKNVCEEFSSYNMHVSMTVPKKEEVVNIAAMIAKQS
ncbi:hypothetical protein DL768_011112 [Monosporascus sp. mg162]|nr:hypothetical protein DL768_011112 [Monosporascus sp. mg162]